MFDMRTSGAIGALYDSYDHRTSINCIEFDLSRNLLINGGNAITGFDIRYPTEHKQLFQFKENNQQSWANVLKLNGTTLVSALANGTVGVYDTDLAEPRCQQKLQLGRKAILSLHVDDTRIIAGTWDGRCHLINFLHSTWRI